VSVGNYYVEAAIWWYYGMLKRSLAREIKA